MVGGVGEGGHETCPYGGEGIGVGGTRYCQYGVGHRPIPFALSSSKGLKNGMPRP